MPTQYVIDIANRIVRTTFSGVVTCHQVAAHARRLRDDPAFEQNFSELVMFGENSDIQLKYLDWQSLSDVDPFSPSSKRAFVVHSRSAVYGAIRMNQAARGETINIRIFETADEALFWLSAPKPLARAEGR